MVPAELDHLVWGVPDLLAGVARFTELSGVSPVPGGRHVGRGTANYLVGFGEEHPDAYLEVLGPDPASAEPPTLLGLPAPATPRLLTWAIHPSRPDELVAAAKRRGHDPGPLTGLSRTTPDGELMRWRLTAADHERTGGIAPFVIDWLDTVPPPHRDLPPVSLLGLSATHPQPDRVGAALAALGVTLPVLDGPAGLAARIAGRHGEFTLH